MFFIIREENHMTVYAGDWDSSKLIVIGRTAQVPNYIDMQHQPRRAELINND
jgi:hypothetical protein